MLTVSEIAQIQVAWYAFDASIDDKHDNSKWLEKISFMFTQTNTRCNYLFV